MIKKAALLVVLHVLSVFSLVCAQSKQYKVVNVAFYNLENLFDTVHTQGKNDYEFLPGGQKKYTGAVYQDKLKNLASVLRDIGTDLSPDGPAIIGVSEVENRNVLQDLVNHEYIRSRQYQIVHYESPDARGIDVGFLYNPKYFEVEASKPVTVQLPPDADGSSHPTRDILVVKGKLDGELYYVLVNHWPSRLGGAASAPSRLAAATVCRRTIDSLSQLTPNANIVVMGDLNDNPDNISVTKGLMAAGKTDKLKAGELFNPWAEFYNKGIGTLAYQDAWALFDQIIISQHVLDKTASDHFRFYKASIFRRDDMIQTSGRYKGYPKRTYDFDNYMSGFSDHFPTYISLIKVVK
jgi:endonuclease/exonuclease/phosphatase family metal-dependent hydrolase